ncbi:unnamed protein product, partial [Symbiodinium necroappetens]
DAMAPVLEFIEGLLEVISGGLFDPDRTRCRGLSGLRSEEEAGPSIAPEVDDVWSPEEPLDPGGAVSEGASSSASLRDEEESEDADRMAEFAGEQVAETIQGANFGIPTVK